MKSNDLDPSHEAGKYTRDYKKYINEVSELGKQ